jgi:hypothetical protein
MCSQTVLRGRWIENYLGLPVTVEGGSWTVTVAMEVEMISVVIVVRVSTSVGMISVMVEAGSVISSVMVTYEVTPGRVISSVM